MGSNEKEWHQAIAKRASVDVSRVRSVLVARHIHATPVLPQPKRLALTHISFSGTKDGVAAAGPFSFEWKGLGPGLWAILTDRNLRGKSSIIEVVRWLLRGRPSTNLQEDVLRWIREATIRFQLDGIDHEVQVSLDRTLSGHLSRVDTSRTPAVVLAKFKGEDEFEAAMANFFMPALTMETITTWRSNENKELAGQAISHGWASFSGAMFIGTDYEVLLGDLPVGAGLNSRLMQMYLGLPWVSTLAAAKSALQAVRNDVEITQRRLTQAQAARQARVDTINGELEDKRALLSSFASDKEIRDALTALGTEVSTERKRERALEARLERDIAAIHQAETAYQEDRRDLQTHLDSVAANAVFRRLDPTFCPRCDHSIDEERKKREQSTHSCSVCGEAIASDVDADSMTVEFERRIKASKAALDRARDGRQSTQAELTKLQERITQIQESMDEHTTKLNSYTRRQELLQQIAVLEGRLQEATLEPQDQRTVSDEETKILDAIVSETESRVKSLRDDLLNNVSTRIVEYAQRFGMGNLTKASLKGNAALSLDKGGVSTSYSRVTQGEKLRLKVATVLAMIQIAEKSGIGRHPGLLMIDSPAAHEVTPHDVAQLVAGLRTVSAELPHLQVFVAGLTSPSITAHIPKSSRIEASDGKYLW